MPILPLASWIKNRGTVSKRMNQIRPYPKVAPTVAAVRMLGASTSAIITIQAGPNDRLSSLSLLVVGSFTSSRNPDGGTGSR
jgi:hypothetical protein